MAPSTGKKRKATQPSRAGERVSESSLWGDRIWQFANETAGQRESQSAVDWGFDLGDKRNLFDHGPPELLEELRVFVDTWRRQPQGGKAAGAGSMSNVELALGAIVRWMAEEGLTTVSDVTEEMSWAFVDWLFASYEVVSEDSESPRIGRPRQLTHSSAIRIVNVLLKLYEQRAAMRRAGVGALLERPFGPELPDGEGGSISALRVVTEAMGLERSGRLLPIPDTVALPILAAAIRMTLIPADDVILLQTSALDKLDGLPYYDNPTDATGYADARDEVRGAIEAFTFRCCETEDEPWREKIEPGIRRTMLNGREVELSSIQQLRRLIISVTEACVTVLQGLSGMRAHEIIGLDAETVQEDGTPSCLASRFTRDGSFEVFYVEGRTSKGKKRKTYWVIGARPAGSEFVPPAVRAVRVLGKLLEPWRKIGGRRSLLVTFTASRGLPKQKKSIGGVLACSLTYWQKEFVHEYVDLDGISDELKNEFVVRKSLRGHRWRATFAVFLFRIHSKLVPALADHFKHTSEVMTQHGYIGNDPSLLDAFDSARVQFTGQVLLQIASGNTPIAGSAAHLVAKHRAELSAQIGDVNEPAALERAEAFVRLHGLNIWNASHGCCLMVLMPDKSRCRQMSGSAGWKSQSPDLAVRTPTVCAGCQCLLVRREHEPYWRSALDEHDAVLSAAESGPRKHEFRVESSRAALARTFLARLEAGKSAQNAVKG